VVGICLGQHFAQGLEEYQILLVQDVVFSVELQYLFGASIKLGRLEEEVVVEGNVLALSDRSFLLHRGVTGGVGFSICLEEAVNLLNVSSAELFASTESFRSFKSVGSIVEGELAHDAVSELNIKHVVVLTSREEVVTLVMLSLRDTDTVTTSRTVGVGDHFSKEIPLVLSFVPAVSCWLVLVLVDLSLAIFISHDFAIHF